MPAPPRDPHSVESICKSLVVAGMISREQARSLVDQQRMLKTKLAQRRKRERESPGGDRAGSVVHLSTMVDVLASLHLSRADSETRELDEDSIFEALASAWNLPFLKIDPLKLNLNVVTTTIPRNFAKKHLVLPIAIEDGELTLATPNPFNLEAMEDISRVTPLKLKTVVSPKRDVIKIIDEFFGFKRSIAAAEDQFDGVSVDLGNLEAYVKLQTGDELASNDHHIVNAVNHLLVYAFDQRASDIHIEPKRDITLVRMRIDGVLHTIYKLPKKVHNAIVSRIKAMSRLNMAEKRRPQDGRIKTDKGGAEVEIRISTVPVAFGEKAVMRVMDPDVLFQDLSGLGFSEDDLTRYRGFVGAPHGIALVTGPTGSGKSTTLYSTLRTIASAEINVITVEDPIEMIHEDFNQIGVQPSAGVTFGSILRTILRQDPDIIMIGEMRDLETAQNAVQAALTGHLVLSTLHTNDAPTAITRLLDLGVPPFLIQATLVGIQAQRLVRKICPQCGESFSMSVDELVAMGVDTGQTGEVSLRRGKGCARCRNTGYFGRVGVFEVMPYTERIRQLTQAQVDIELIRRQARQEGMATLRESAVEKLISGRTTVQEVVRVTYVND